MSIYTQLSNIQPKTGFNLQIGMLQYINVIFVQLSSCIIAKLSLYICFVVLPLTLIYSFIVSSINTSTISIVFRQMSIIHIYDNFELFFIECLQYTTVGSVYSSYFSTFSSGSACLK